MLTNNGLLVHYCCAKPFAFSVIPDFSFTKILQRINIHNSSPSAIILSSCLQLKMLLVLGSLYI